MTWLAKLGDMWGGECSVGFSLRYVNTQKCIGNPNVRRRLKGEPPRQAYATLEI